MTNRYNGITYRTHPFIEEYFELIESGKIVVCKEQYQLRDLIIGKLSRGDVYIDSGQIEKAVETKERYFYPEFPFQKFIDCFIYGVFTEENALVYDRFFILLGRGNGKNGYISPNIWYLTTEYHGVKRYEIELVANSEKQVKTSFDDVFLMLEDNKERMRPHYKWTQDKIVSKKTGSKIQWHTSNSNTKDSLRAGAVVFDEVHQYLDYSNINVYITALGKVPRPRVFWITTDGLIRGHVLDDYKITAKEVLEGNAPESSMFPFICKLDSKDEMDNPEAWPKANPAWYYLPELRKEMIREYKDGRNNPELWRGFVAKRLNLPAQDSAAPVASWEDIEATEQEMPDLTGWQCIGWLDYAETTDYVACGLLFKRDGVYYVKHHSFICNVSLQKAMPKFPVHEAAEKGLCTIIYESYIDASVLANWFAEQSNRYSLVGIACDRFRIAVIKNAFYTAGLDVVPTPKGPITHSKIAPMLDVLFTSRRIVYGDDFMMRWYTNNVYKNYLPNGNVSYEKIEPKLRKTDGFHGLLAGFAYEDKTPLPDYGATDWSILKTRVY